MTTLITYTFLQIIIMLLLAPLPTGIIRKIKARFQKRRGASIFQPYYDLIKLLKKPQVTISTTSSKVLLLTPYILLGSTLLAACLVPLSTKVTVNLPGDMLVLVYTLALGGFFLTLAALDTSSTFGGMGSSRENTLKSIIEPALIIALVTLAIYYGSTDLRKIMIESANSSLSIDPVHLLLLLALLMVTIAETARIPIDDPSTHLELTMIHEAMILEYSGRHLGLVELAAYLKQLIYITLIANIFFPHDQLISFGGILGIVLSLSILVLKVIIISIILGLIETNTVKLRFFSIANYAALAVILSLLGFLCVYIF